MPPIPFACTLGPTYSKDKRHRPQKRNKHRNRVRRDLKHQEGNIWQDYRRVFETGNRKADYERYRFSFEWKRKADWMKNKYGWACQLDENHKENIMVHHRTYKNLFNEDPRDLTVLCGECHRKVHGIES